MTGVRIVARAAARAPRPGLEDRFRGRWDPRRPIHPEAALLVQAVADALGAAGWWSEGAPGAGADGLVVGSDVQWLESAARFSAHLARGLATPPPSDYLLTLPSSAAAIAGVALGLVRYQATIAMHGLSGFQAVVHAAERLRLGRLDRVVAAAHTRVGPLVASRREFEGAGEFGLAVAWCLERGEPGIAAWGTGEAPGARDTLEVLGDVPGAYRGLAAPALLAAGRWIERAGACTVLHRDPHLAGAVWIEIEDQGCRPPSRRPG